MSPVFVRLYPEYQEKMQQQRLDRQNGAADASEQDAELPSDSGGDSEVGQPGAPGFPPHLQLATAVAAVAVALGVVYLQYMLGFR
jgi:hypothetical protein